MSDVTSVSTRRQRPVWLATALTVLSLGSYYIWWFGASWSEFKRERGDISMRPVWHALTSLVPVYASFRAHAHFRALADLARPRVAGLPDRAAWAAWIISIDWLVGLTSIFFTQGIVAVILGVVGAGLYAVVVWQGQSDFNAYLRATGGDAVERAHAVEIIALAICVPLAIAWVYFVLQPLP